MPRRPAHKTVHSPCPNGMTSWADCDYKNDWRFGHCKAMVQDKHDPHECSNRAMDEGGYCGMHYANEIERNRKAERIAIKRDAMNARADAYIEWTRDHPSIHDRMSDPAASAPRRKGPHRING